MVPDLSCLDVHRVSTLQATAANRPISPTMLNAIEDAVSKILVLAANEQVTVVHEMQSHVRRC